GSEESSGSTMSGMRFHMPTSSLRNLTEENEPRVRSDSPSLLHYALAALALCALDDRSKSSNGPEFRFLQQHLEQHAGDINGWRNELEIYLRHPGTVDVPLLDLGAQIGLSVIEILAVTLAAAVETDVIVGRTVAWLQAPVGGSRPTLALIG